MKFNNCICVFAFFVFMITSSCADSICENSQCEVPINVSIGDNFTISLESNPGSTGYDWWVDFDPLYVQLEEKSFEVDEKDSLIGQPGMKYFTFAAKKLGSTHISLLLVRPWKNSTVADLKIYPVNIMPS